MARPAIKTTQRTGRPLYHSAKISEQQFRQVLWHFVRDDTATATARQTGLSLNSVAAIFQKVRVYFFEAGLFMDPYEGKDPETFEGDNEEFELRLLTYHFERIRDKRGLKSPIHKPDYHLAESHWRFNFHVIRERRPDADFHKMMLTHLLDIIRICGPVGRPPVNRKAGLRAVLGQQDQFLIWLERNAPGFDDASRDELRDIRSILPED